MHLYESILARKNIHAKNIFKIERIDMLLNHIMYDVVLWQLRVQSRSKC